MSPEEGVDVVRQLKIQKDRAGDWSLAQVKACTNNLLRFYHSRLASDKQVVRQPDFPLANKFATIIFSLHLASSIIETYFSKTRYAKNKHRSRLSDDLASATLHIQQLRSYQDAETLESSSALTLDLEAALRYVENNLDDLRRKYLDKRISKPFFDEQLERVRDYAGHVSSVDFSRDSGCVLFQIDYDSDSDAEDMELWELKEYIQE